MSKNNFSRSNVNEQMLNVSMPDMSAFNMSHSVNLTPTMGDIIPFWCKPLIPRAVINGANKPELQLEKILTPSIGRVRMDTHNFVVLANRINRDWKFFVEQKSGYTYKPGFYPYRLMAEIFAFLIGQDPTISLSDISYSYSSNVTLSFSNSAVLSSSADDNSYLLFLQALYNNVLSVYKGLIDDNVEYLGFNQDFYRLEFVRIGNIRKSLSSSSLPNFADVILSILKPFFGVGSLFDMLGYPIFDQYSKVYETLRSVFVPYNPESISQNSYFSSNAHSIILGSRVSIIAIFCSYLTGEGVDEGSFALFDDIKKDEMPLRAYYAVWFDYFRNFHVEKRENILDPDTFDNKSIILANEYLSTADSTSVGMRKFNVLVTLLIPRKRNFARDYITTIQVDDIYRYVYTPWVGQGQVMTTPDTGDVEKFYDNIDKLLIENKWVNFPRPDQSPNGYTRIVDVLKADLMTMRRSKMLERVLAREYYYPDTYAGRMLAHYGIKPGDIDSMNSVYLSGSEQFVSGDQQHANIGTSETPIGTRTLVAGVSSVDGYNYAATDHCYFICTISLVPMVSYNSANMHLDELDITSLPLPQFASDTRCLIRARDLIRGLDEQVLPFGYVPRYYAYRVQADESHGKFLTDYRSYNFLRDWYNSSSIFASDISTTWNDSPNPIYNVIRQSISLSPYFLRVNVPLDAFLGLSQGDPIAFGSIDISCSLTQPLPAAIEFI